MITYKDTFNLDHDHDVDVSDTLANALYNSSRLNYMFKNVEPSTDEPMNASAYNYRTEVNGGIEPNNMVQDNVINTTVNDTALVRNLDTFKTSGVAEDVGYSGNSGKTTFSEHWKLLRVIAGAHQGWVRCCAVDEITNKWYATGSSDSSIKIWDLASLKTKAIITGHIMGVRAVKISKRYPYLFSGSEDKTVRCWDLEKTNSALGCQIRNYHGHVGGIYSLAIHPELDLLFSGGRDSVVRAWDIRSRAQAMVLTGHKNDITSIESEVGDPQVITSSMDGTLRLWDLRKAKTALAITQHSKSIRLLVMHPEELTMCSADTNGEIKQWLLPMGELLDQFGAKAEQSNVINTMAINPVENVLCTGYDDGRLEFYDYTNGSILQSERSRPLPGSTETSINSVAFDVLGSRMISCESDKSIKIWGPETV